MDNNVAARVDRAAIGAERADEARGSEDEGGKDLREADISKLHTPREI